MAVVDLSKIQGPTEVDTKVRTGLSKFVYDNLLLPKLLYFVITCVIYSTHTFALHLLVDDLGLKMREAGYIFALNFLNFFGSIFWGYFADRTGLHKHILIACCVLYALCFTLSSLGKINDGKDKALLYIVTFDKQKDRASLLLYTGVFFGLAQFFCAALFPLIDNQVVQMISSHPRFSKEVFGRIRLWSTLGHTFITLMLGLLKDQLPDTLKKLAMTVCLLVSTFLFIVLAILAIKTRRIKKGKAGPAAAPQCYDSQGRPISPIKALLSKPSYLFFLVFIFLASFNRSIMSSFYPYFLSMIQTHNAGFTAHKTQNNLLTAAVKIPVSISEIVVFFFGKPLMAYLGVHWMLILAQVSGIVRVLVFAAIPYDDNSWMCSYAVELLKGINTAFLITASVKIIVELTPKGAESSGQSIFSGVYSGFSMGVASLVGGLLCDPEIVGTEKVITGNAKYDSTVARIKAFQLMFWVTVAISTAGLILYFVKYALIEKKLTFKFPVGDHHSKPSAVAPAPAAAEKEQAPAKN